MAARIKWDARNYEKRLQRATVAAVGGAAIFLETKVKEALNKGDGRIKPSKPGTPPHKRTGTLGRSITALPALIKGKRVSSKVGTNLIYGAVHEHGSITNNTPQRSFLASTARKEQDVIVRSIKKIIAKRMKKK